MVLQGFLNRFKMGQGWFKAGTGKSPGKREAGLVLLAGFLFFLLLDPHISSWLNPPTGDEPFYLVTASTLVNRHTLDETESYLNHDYWNFAPGCREMAVPHWGDVGPKAINSVPGVYAPGLNGECYLTPSGFDYLPPHFSKNTIRPGSYTKHGIGLSLLIAPAYALGNRGLVMVFMNLLAALVGLNCWLLAWEVTRKRRVAWLVWLALLFTAPLLPFAFLIFPAIPGALLTIYSWRRLRLVAQARIEGKFSNRAVVEVNGGGRAFLVGLCIAFLPWLHSVYLSISLPLFLYFLLGGRGRRIKGWLPGWSPLAGAFFGFPIILSSGFFTAFYIYLYGTPFPNTQDHAGFAPLNSIWLGVLGFLFDQKYGLLIYAPIYLLALAGLIFMGLRTGDVLLKTSRRSDLTWVGLALLPNFLVMSDYNQWWGEWGPPARYLAPLVPVLAAPLAVTLVEAKNWLVKGYTGLSFVWSGAIAITWMVNPHLMFHWQDANPAKILTWLQDNTFLRGSNLAVFFPSYVTNLQATNGQANTPAALVWGFSAALIMVTILLLAFKGHKTNPPATPQEIDTGEELAFASRVDPTGNS